MGAFWWCLLDLNVRQTRGLVRFAGYGAPEIKAMVCNSKLPEYRVWSRMNRRCYDKRLPGYHRYGGRGIRVHHSWRVYFHKFLAYMGPRPSPQHSIERIDNNGNYEPGNCRWATRKEQSRNTRRNRMFVVNGQAMCLKDVAAQAGVCRKLLGYRLQRGMTLEQALAKPVRVSVRKAI